MFPKQYEPLGDKSRRSCLFNPTHSPFHISWILRILISHTRNLCPLLIERGHVSFSLSGYWESSELVLNILQVWGWHGVITAWFMNRPPRRLSYRGVCWGWHDQRGSLCYWGRVCSWVMGHAFWTLRIVTYRHIIWFEQHGCVEIRDVWWLSAGWNKLLGRITKPWVSII
jgi:hypothetical protein